MTKKELLKTFLMHNAQRNIVYTVYGQSKKLPDEYQEVEYLESTGTQWIDTGAIPKISHSYSIKFRLTQTDINSVIFGSRTSGTYLTSRNQIYLNAYIGSSLNEVLYNIYGENNKLLSLISTDIKEYIKIKNDNFILENSTRPYYIFALNNLGIASVQSKLFLYYFKIYDNNTLVRNFIPCYRKADNVAGMYDLVNGQFYTNQGTGEFIVGNDVPSTIVSIKPPISFGEKKLGKNLIDIEDFSLSTTDRKIDTSFNNTYTFSCEIYSPNNTATGSASVVQLTIDGTVKYILVSRNSLTGYYREIMTFSGNLSRIRFTNYGVPSGENIYFRNIQLEEGSTATAYEPYIGDLRGIGEVKDILETSGTLTRKLEEVDLGSLNWVYQSENTRWYVSGDGLNIKAPITQADIANALCEKYTVISFYTANQNKNGFAITSNATIYYYTTDSTNKPSGLMIYELATPTETTFTPLELTSGLTVVDSNGTTPEYTEN